MSTNIIPIVACIGINTKLWEKETIIEEKKKEPVFLQCKLSRKEIDKIKMIGKYK